MSDRILLENRRNSVKDLDTSLASSPEHYPTINEDNVIGEIPAARVRSGLSELESHISHGLHCMENLKCSTAPLPPSVADTASSAALFLAGDHKPTGEIFGLLESLVAHTESPADEGHFPLPQLDDVAYLALMSHSLVAYMTHLDFRKLTRITQKISSDTARWLSHLFRFQDASASYHTDSSDAILRAVRLAIVTRCPGYLEGGVPALAQPCLYISDQSASLGLQFACRQLGLPLNSIRTVPTSTTMGAIGSMDVSALQKLIATDVAANRTPLFLVADVGSSLCGNVDNIARLKDVCRANSVWLHCRGHALAAIAVARGTNSGGEAQPIADSIALGLGGWLGLPNLPVALLHRPIQNVALSVFDSDPVLSRRLSSLSLWTTLQGLGRNALCDRMLTAFESCRLFYDVVTLFEHVKVISKPPGGDTKTSITDLEHRPLSYPLLFETATVVVVFQFDGHAAQRSADLEHAAAAAAAAAAVSGDGSENGATAVAAAASEAAENSDSSEINQSLIHKSIEKVANSVYFDKLNTWLGQNLKRDNADLDLELIDHPSHGVCIRFCPFELGLGLSPPNRGHLEQLAETLDSQFEVLRATVKHRGTLNRLVEKSDVLRIVPLTDWAGLGGVRFVPEGWEQLLTDQAKTELNKLNAELVETLRSTDNAFSMGEDTDGLVCILFGMVTADTDVEELLSLVEVVGRRVQENSKVLDTMSEIVKKGIETATADLQRESEEKLWSEGILRHVPVFGQVVNWWSPPVKETGIKGRSLNLTQGVVESTENIYKYHMQLSRNNNPPKPGSKSPPAPLVQTSVSANHSRNVSQGSVTSTTDSTTTHPSTIVNSATGTTTVSTVTDVTKDTATSAPTSL